MEYQEIINKLQPNIIISFWNYQQLWSVEDEFWHKLTKFHWKILNRAEVINVKKKSPCEQALYFSIWLLAPACVEKKQDQGQGDTSSLSTLGMEALKGEQDMSPDWQDWIGGGEKGGKRVTKISSIGNQTRHG